MPKSVTPLTTLVTVALTVLLLSNNTSLAQQQKSKSTTLEGQLVCSLCWFEADRNTTPYGTPDDLKCAADCVEKGIPPAVAVKKGGDYQLFIIEQGSTKRTPKEWLPDLGKQVRISGLVREASNKSYIATDKVSVIGESPFSIAQQQAIGTQAELQLKDLFGVDQQLSSYRGRIVILNFWATWCVPCKAELPDLVSLQNDYAALGVQVIGASADPLQDRSKVLKFIKETRINFPVWVGLNTDEMKRFGVGPSLPATIIIGRDGKISASYPGVITLVDVRKQIDGMLGADALALKRESNRDTRARDVSLVPS